MNLQKIQQVLTENNLDGWLFADFRGRDYIATRLLNLNTEHLATRRWFYFIPKSGTPQKLVSIIESGYLEDLEGDNNIFRTWQEMQEKLQTILNNSKNIAMQYSPNNAIPYISIVDAGTIELIRSFGLEIVSSGDLVSVFEAYINKDDKETHIKAGELVNLVKDEAFAFISKKVRNGEKITEFDVQTFVRQRFDEVGLFWDHGPIVAVNEHAADPHFDPTPDNSYEIKMGDLVLLDIFAKLKTKNAIWYDITWMAYMGDEVPPRVQELFEYTRDARDKGLELVKQKFANNEKLTGYEVDEIVRNHIKSKGLDDYFTHRTGHNIATNLHGNGAHLDSFETLDNRTIIKGSCFSIEPGIYKYDEKLGFRCEIDVFINDDGSVEVFGPIQSELVLL